MPVDLAPWFADPGTLPARTRSALAQTMKGSAILAIAGEVLDLQAKGHDIANFTIGDFAPSEFRVPPLFLQHLQEQQNNGQTFYPPAVGTAELRAAVRRHYRHTLGLDYPEGTVQVGSGARPLIFAAFACLVSPGDTVVYQVPSWNTSYYIELNQGVGVELVARPEDGFMLTADAVRPHLSGARLIVLNSPQNPSGTAISEDSLRAICEEIVAENHRREAVGDRPLYLLYDMVYWQLTVDGVDHHTPVGVVPEMAKYTVMVDAISKSWAATGVRVGWSVSPPWLRDPMKALIGHMGAWAGRAPQLATAKTLDDVTGMQGWMDDYRAKVAGRLTRLHAGFERMSHAGLPLHAVPPEGALYLTVRFDLHGRTVRGRTIQTDEDIRSVLLHEAGTAVVPFVTFGYPEGSGWMRFSIGAVSNGDLGKSLDRIEHLLSEG